jgi:hypothetical protein
MPPLGGDMLNTAPAAARWQQRLQPVACRQQAAAPRLLLLCPPPPYLNA